MTVVSYLAISDFYSIGEEQRYSFSTDKDSISASAEEDSSGPLSEASAKEEGQRNGAETIRTGHLPPGQTPAEAHVGLAKRRESFSSKLAMAGPKIRKRGAISPHLDPDVFSLDKKARKLGETPSAKTTRVKGNEDAPPRSSDNNFSIATKPNIDSPQLDSPQARASPGQSSPLLQLSTLATVTGTNATRNKQVNILAMIDYVSNSTVKPATAPLKRDIRIVDPSTDKKVTLSVFVDPVRFTPNEYDIMLFLNLTTHDFSGGNLNVYPKKCRGKEWYILDPYDIKECDMKSMEVFRETYRKRKAQVLR